MVSTLSNETCQFWIFYVWSRDLLSHAEALTQLSIELRKSTAQPKPIDYLIQFSSVLTFPLLTQKQSNLLLAFRNKAEAIPAFNVLSSKMCSAILTSCFELSCVSCPLTKQKLADLMCITQLKKKIRQGFRYAKQAWVKRIKPLAYLILIK